ncbi:ATP phosphoribosyltransferase regulatory subunit [Corticibacter populi]|uniref:ATP phosphoribosyltransferase regulatory subunit n=1 Tax=Corticibacter populi TaxID=1550736 RepID=A0A3M6R036_9BURK|nr:ATP phosphoribosyltransferase regulatory subunit [Corticibacter populi]RMX08598.1 ATP phosphoribosyltransferase regulatory subunit [Corticibacter populi]RZS35924.1 ATP phosphoribosyltransferase regulatory subunit [Corticibacter populi]
MSAWVLPDHIADILPSEARHMEELRRSLLDVAATYGYELVIPPLMEYLESLLTGTGQALDLQTFKTVDQLSGRTVGIRADSTQQVARIDAHLLNRAGVARLCYCGPVLHTMPERPYASREPLQFGAEIYGHDGLEADLEALSLALDCLRKAAVSNPMVVMGDVRIARSLMGGVMVGMDTLRAVHAALAAKDASTLAQLTETFPAASREGLMALLDLYGGPEVLEAARARLAHFPQALKVLGELEWIGARMGTDAAVGYDLADLQGYAYYSGLRFTMYADRCTDALVRGGRYDEVGAAFGRNRPAAGFSLDIKQLVSVAAQRPLQAAIRAPWSEDGALGALIRSLRQAGETVICALPGHASEVDEFLCDRELVHEDGNWRVHPLQAHSQ